jgi:F0F1-type ATP synthase membrane subunit b/b'
VPLAVTLAVKIVVLAITFGPIVVFAGFLVWGAIQDGRDERRSRRVTRG